MKAMCLLSIRVGSRVSSKPSTEFENLLEGLLTKDASRRMTWGELVVHPFWQGALQQLTQEMETMTDVRQSLRQSAANFTSTVTNDRLTTTGMGTTHTAATDHTDATLGHTTDDRPGQSDYELGSYLLVWLSDVV